MGLITNIKNGITNLIFKRNNSSAFSGSFISLWDKISGSMQPTDFAKQVQSNEGWVYACVSAISESVAMARISLHIQKGDKAEEVKDHIFIDLWRKVNPFMNNFQLRVLTEAYQLLCGNAYWYVIRNGLGVPVEIWPVPAHYMTVVPDRQKFISGYIYQSPGGEKIAFDTEEIIHFKYPNVNNMFYGMGPLLAAVYEVDIAKYMNLYQANLFKNQAVPQAILSTEAILNEVTSKRMREEWQQLYGGVNKTGKVAILQKGLKFQNIQLSNIELAYIQSKNINRDTILGIFRVPKSILGIVEDVNRANAEASEYVFALRNIKPKLIQSEEKLNESLMPMYKQNGRNYLFVKYADPVPQNRELIIKERESRLSTGYSSINEEREKNGDKPVPWGDVPIMSAVMAPLGSAPDAVPPIPPAEPAKALPEGTKSKAFTAEEKKAIWLQFSKRLDAQTLAFKRGLGRAFSDQRKEVLKNLNEYFGKGITKDLGDAFLFVRAEAEKLFAELFMSNFETAYESGANNGIDLAGLQAAFDVGNPAAQKFLKEKIFRFSFQVNDTTINQLRAEFAAGIQNGEGIPELSARVNKIFDFATIYRAERIARTEIAEVENHALMDVWTTATEVVEMKEWLHGGGGNDPRPEHEDMNGEQVAVGERFSNGMMYPGDPDGGPEETINCTCTMLPVVKNN